MGRGRERYLRERERERRGEVVKRDRKEEESMKHEKVDELRIRTMARDGRTPRRKTFEIYAAKSIFVRLSRE